MPWRYSLQRSLKTRLALLVVACVLLGMWALAWFALHHLRLGLQVQLQAQQQTTAALLAQSLERALRARMDALESVAQVISAVVEREPLAAQDMLTSRTVLQQMFNGGTFVVNAAGGVTATYPHRLGRQRFNYRDAAYVQSALAGRSSVSQPLTGRITHAPLIAMSTPVRGLDGGIVGALVGIVDLSQDSFVDTHDLLSERAHQARYYTIDRASHTIVSSSEKARVLQKLQVDGDDALLDHFVRTGAGSVLARLGGQEVLASAQQVPLADWSVVVAQPSAEVFAPLQVFRMHLVLVALALASLTAVALWWLLRRGLAPLSQMAHDLSAMARQEIALRPLCADGTDEIAQIAQSFNHLQSELVQRQHAMQEAQERYLQAFNTSPDALDITRVRDGRHLEINPGFERLFGWSRAEVLGQTGLDLGIWRDASARARLVAQVLEHGVCLQQEQQLFHRNGTPLTVLMSASTLHLNGELCFLWVTHDITAYRQAHAQIERLTFVDTLTGLPNLEDFLPRLERAQAQCLEQGQQGALLCLDVDDFNSLNDALGRDQGDALLRAVAQRLREVIGTRATVARMGGDEFVLLLSALPPQLAAHDAQQLASDLQRALSRPLSLLEGLQHESGACVGITLFGWALHEPKELLRQAVIALNQAKDTGPGTLIFFDAQFEDQVSSRARLQRSLRQALQEQQFVLHYQPQVSATGAVVGVEALVRWPLPERGMVSPAEFIPLAEKTGLIIPLGRWILHAACSQLAAWAHHSARSHLDIAVNVSAVQFGQEDFVQTVREVLQETGAPAQRLKLELTESLMMHDIDEVIARMTVLQQLGVRFSLDDFGTGFSSLTYLKRLPLYQLKIDQGFVRDMLEHHNDAAIAQTVIALGQRLGLEVVAEGVETQAHRDALAQWGCRYYQGYFFSKPLTIELLEVFLQARASVSEPLLAT